MKQMPMLSFASAVHSPASAASLRTAVLCRSPTGSSTCDATTGRIDPHSTQTHARGRGHEQGPDISSSSALTQTTPAAAAAHVAQLLLPHEPEEVALVLARVQAPHQL
jgi:hypothetical protein